MQVLRGAAFGAQAPASRAAVARVVKKERTFMVRIELLSKNKDNPFSVISIVVEKSGKYFEVMK